MAPSVNRPVDEKLRATDIDRKLQLWGIFEGFRQGKVPSNDQIDVALNSFLASKSLSSPAAGLSDEGKHLVADVRDVVTKAKQLLLSKNNGNLLQDFIWQSQNFNPATVATPNAPVDKNTAKQHGNDALQGLRTLGTLVITNGQFRKLLKDASVLLRDIAGDAASNAANKVRPSDEQLQHMDRPAEDNTWHDAPDLSKDGLKSKAQGVYHGNPVEDAKQVANAAAGSAGAKNTNDPQKMDVNAGASAAQQHAKDKINANLDDETQDKIKARKVEYQQRTKEYLKKKMPEERREQTIWRLKKMVLECQQHPDYSQAMQTLLDLAEQYGRHTRTVVQDSTGTAKQTRSNLALAEADLKTLIERFANGTSSDDLWDSLDQIYRDADADSELKGWFKDMDRFARRSLLEQGYILDDASTDEWNRLYDRGHFLLREKYRGHTNRFLDEVKFLADQFDQDPQNRAFAASVQKLFTDLGNDENGKASFKSHLVKDLTQIILPALFENVSYIPVPRIEYTDKEFDAVIENLVLESDNFMPNLFEFQNEANFRFGRKDHTSGLKNAVDVTVKGIQMDLRDVSYYVKRKHGFPALSDTGSANIYLPGDGFNFRLKLRTAEEKDRQHFFLVDKVDVNFKKFNIKLTRSKYKVLFNLFKPVMLKVLRPAIGKAIEKAIKDQVTELDALLWELKQEADRALEQVSQDPDSAPNLYRRYVDAAQKRFMQGKQKAKEVAADKKVNVAVTREESMFKDVQLPGGISTKATEYRELARKGDSWESPVFSIGSASKSTDIPATPRIERKPHNTATPNAVTSSNYSGSNYTSGNYTGGNYGGDYASNAYGSSGVGQNGLGLDKSAYSTSSAPVAGGSSFIPVQ